jgi:hypothetical protein
MALYKQKDYYEKFKRKADDYRAFINRVLIPKFGRTERSYYNDDKTYIYKNKDEEKLFRDIGENNDNF